MASFLDLRDHFRLLGVCKALEVVCREPTSFAPVLDHPYGRQDALTRGLTKLAECRVRPAGLVFHAGRGGLCLPDAFVAWLASGGAANLARIDLAHITNAQSVVAALALVGQQQGQRVRELGLRSALKCNVHEAKATAAVGTIASHLGTLIDLTSLDLANNQLSFHQVDGGDATLAAGSAAVATAVGKLTKLTCLDVTGNWLGVETFGSATIATNLGHLKQLTSLRISNNKLGYYQDAQAASLATNLGQLVQLTVLNLANNQLLLASPALAEAVGQLTRLTTLNLSANYLGDHDQGGAAWAVALGHLVQLTSLDVSLNRLCDLYDQGGPGLLALAASLGHLTRLKHLSMTDNGLGYHQGAGARALATPLATLTQLTSLDLSFNDLTCDPRPAGYRRLRQALDQLPLLTVLCNDHNDSGRAIVFRAE